MYTRMGSLLVALGVLLSPQLLRAQPSGFEQIPYQGRLELSGNAQDGAFDFRFEIVDQAGSILWVDTFSSVQVYNGGFTVGLGAGAPFPGDLWANDDLYLQIQVRPAGTNSFTALSGRQRILSVPFAQRSSMARDYHVTGSLMVDSGASIQGDLSVSGQVTTGSQQVLGSQLVTGDQQLEGGLQVAGPVTLGATTSVLGDLAVSGDLLIRGRHDSVTNPAAPSITTSHWDIHTSRYRLSIGSDFADLSYPVPQQILEDYCADEDGCRVKVGMSGWGIASSVMTTRTCNMSYDTATGRYRIEDNETAGYIEAIVGDHEETILTCPDTACCLLDYNYAAGIQDDDSRQFYLHWSTIAFNVASKKCILILED